MNLIKTKIIFTFLFINLLLSFYANSQTNQEILMEQAVQLFNVGNFKQAEPLFKQILDEIPDDFMVNYYYGSCRTENNHFSNSDLESLIVGNQESTPVNINYYFGIQYHARSNWERALKFYNKFNSSASLTDKEKQNLLEKIQQCYDKINPFEEYIISKNEEEIIPVLTETNDKNELLQDETAQVDQALKIESEALLIAGNESIEDNSEKGETIEFYINRDITYINTSNFRTEEGRSFFEQGGSKENELNNSLKRVEILRDKYNNSDSSEEKKQIGEEILALESETYSLKRETTQNLLQAKNIENEYWRNATPDELALFKNELKQMAKTNEREFVQENEIETDSAVYIDPNILLGNSEIIVPTENEADNNLVYKIQIGAYSKGLPSYVKRLFDKLSLLRKIENYTDEKGIVVYTTGNLTNYDDAVEMKNQVRQEGVKDAFVVAYFKGKRITLSEAKKLEGDK